MASKLFILFASVALLLSFCLCEQKKKDLKSTTERFDDSDFGISLLDLDENNAKNESSTKKGDGLAGAIIKAVKDFRSDKRSSTVDLRSIFGFGFSDIFGFISQIPKKSPKKRSVEDFLITFAPKSSSLTKEDKIQLDFDDWFNDNSAEKLNKPKDEELDEDELNPQTPRSNINKIPKKMILSRRTKSVDSNVVKVNNNNVTSSESDSKVIDDDEDELVKSLTSARLESRNASGIEGVLDVYSVKRVLQNWDRLRRDLNPECGRHMRTYLSGLVDEKFWALKSKYMPCTCLYLPLQILYHPRVCRVDASCPTSDRFGFCVFIQMYPKI